MVRLFRYLESTRRRNMGEVFYTPDFNNCVTCKESPFRAIPPRKVPESVEIMVIGDTPTAMEIKKGSYLQGPAADILRKTMTKVGLPVNESKVYFTTAIKVAFPKRKGKTIPAEVLRHQHKHIVEEISLVKPKMVLILGKTAMQTVYNNPQVKVNSIMGRVTPIPGVAEEVIAVPILHPALIMRSPGEYKPFLTSIQLVATLFKGGQAYDTGEVGYQVLDTEAKCNSAIGLLSKLPIMRVSADMETTGLDYRIAEFLVLGIGFAKNKVFVIPREMRHRVKDFFAIKHLKWVWQHGKYDTKVMWRRRVGIVPLNEDVMYMHYVLDETSAHDLEHLSKVFLQADAYKYKMNQNFKAISLENYEEWFDALCERVAVDCDYTYQLYDVIMEELEKEPPLKKVYQDVVMPAAPFLAKVEQNGLLVNPTLLEGYGELYEAQLEEIMMEIKEMADPYWDPDTYMHEMGAKTAPPTFNPASPKQMQWMVFKKLKLKPRIKKGMSTGAAILTSIEPQHPLIAKVLKYRKVAKEYSTYVKGIMKWRDVDGRVRTNFNLQVTATGRLSSKEPNVQNIPAAFGVGNIRRAFIPPKGYIFLDSDYEGAELRWLACLSRCPVLLKVFLEGINLHDQTSEGIWGPDFTAQQRMRAKAVNFGIPYGREAPSFVDEFNISMDEAKAMVDGWMNTYYGAAEYLKWCADAVTKGYYLETPFGRRRRAGLVTPDSLHSLQNEFRNFPIQSSSSDTTLMAAMEVEKAGLYDKYDAMCVNLVHDSIVDYIKADPTGIMEFARAKYDIMVTLPERYFGYEVPFSSSVDLGFSWDKDDLVSLDIETGIIKSKKSGKMKLEDWLTTEQERMEEVYSQDWYKTLETI
jgi:uracil-DNA glycosylase family 4